MAAEQARSAKIPYRYDRIARQRARNPLASDKGVELANNRALRTESLCRMIKVTFCLLLSINPHYEQQQRFLLRPKSQGQISNRDGNKTVGHLNAAGVPEGQTSQ